MLFGNSKLDRAFEFIAQTDFDIFCLQEVPEEFLARLKTLPCSIAFCIDTKQPFKKRTRNIFMVILSKYPIMARGELSFPDYWPRLPLRTHLFIWLMRPFGFLKVHGHGALFADIRIPNIQSVVRVFNLHLMLVHPSLRLKEFETAMARRDPSLPTIVCGDFNILEKPHITPLNWFLGGRVTDALFYNSERTHIEKCFVEQELTNVLHGKITHSFSRSQLDHILISKTFSIKNAGVISGRFGSDHHPTRAELT